MSEAGRVIALTQCELTVADHDWPFSRANAAAIDAHWHKSLAENPSYFNGVIHMLGRWTLSGGVLEGEMLRTDFKTFLYWRACAAGDGSVRDAFGSALLMCADGTVILGRQRPGNINAGLVYLPGGFIDARDAGSDGRVDVLASVLREVAEETGLDPQVLGVEPGAVLTLCGSQASIAYRLNVPGSSDAVVAGIRAFLATDPNSELEDVVPVRSQRDLADLGMPEYARLLLSTILPAV